MGRPPTPGGALNARGALNAEREGASAGTAPETVRGGPGVGGPAQETWYGPGSEAWFLNREAILLLGAGPRALLLQIAHPLVAEGVAAHSRFRQDPWGRLRATLHSYLTIVYARPAVARREIGRLLELHRRIRGPVTDAVARTRFGPAYAALDPELLLWVHATLVDSTMIAADAWLAPLDRARRARFYAETLPVGRAFGIPEALLPSDLEAFEGYVRHMLGPDGPIFVTATARELAKTILRPPLGPLATDLLFLGDVARPILEGIPPATYAWLLWPALGLLPAPIRAAYGIRWGRRERLVSAWLVSAWRGWNRVVPAAWRTMPQARAAARREARSSA